MHKVYKAYRNIPPHMLIEKYGKCEPYCFQGDDGGFRSLTLSDSGRELHCALTLPSRLLIHKVFYLPFRSFQFAVLAHVENDDEMDFTLVFGGDRDPLLFNSVGRLGDKAVLSPEEKEEIKMNFARSLLDTQAWRFVRLRWDGLTSEGTSMRQLTLDVSEKGPYEFSTRKNHTRVGAKTFQNLGSFSLENNMSRNGYHYYSHEVIGVDIHSGRVSTMTKLKVSEDLVTATYTSFPGAISEELEWLHIPNKAPACRESNVNVVLFQSDGTSGETRMLCITVDTESKNLAVFERGGMPVLGKVEGKPRSDNQLIGLKVFGKGEIRNLSLLFVFKSPSGSVAMTRTPISTNGALAFAREHPSGYIEAFEPFKPDLRPKGIQNANMTCEHETIFPNTGNHPVALGPSGETLFSFTGHPRSKKLKCMVIPWPSVLTAIPRAVVAPEFQPVYIVRDGEVLCLTTPAINASWRRLAGEGGAFGGFIGGLFRSARQEDLSYRLKNCTPYITLQNGRMIGSQIIRQPPEYEGAAPKFKLSMKVINALIT